MILKDALLPKKDLPAPQQTKKTSQKEATFFYLKLSFLIQQVQGLLFPSFSVYEFWVVKTKLAIYHKCIFFYDQKENMF